jgi:hypothetical protein
MKTGAFMAICSALLGLSCGALRAQDTDATSVDASVHAGIEERAKQEAQPSTESRRRPTSYSRSAFQSTNQPSATQFWLHHATTPAPAVSIASRIPSTPRSLSFRPGTQPTTSIGWPAFQSSPFILPADDGPSGKPHQPPARFQALSIDRPNDGSSGSQFFKGAVQLASPQPETDGFSTPFQGKHLGPASSSFPSPFPRAKGSSSRNKATVKSYRHPQKSGDHSHEPALSGSLVIGKN